MSGRDERGILERTRTVKVSARRVRKRPSAATATVALTAAVALSAIPATARAPSTISLVGALICRVERDALVDAYLSCRGGIEVGGRADVPHEHRW